MLIDNKPIVKIGRTDYKSTPDLFQRKQMPGIASYEKIGINKKGCLQHIIIVGVDTMGRQFIKWVNELRVCSYLIKNGILYRYW